MKADGVKEGSWGIQQTNPVDERRIRREGGGDRGGKRGGQHRAEGVEEVEGGRGIGKLVSCHRNVHRRHETEIGIGHASVIEQIGIKGVDGWSGERMELHSQNQSRRLRNERRTQNAVPVGGAVARRCLRGIGRLSS